MASPQDNRLIDLMDLSLNDKLLAFLLGASIRFSLPLWLPFPRRAILVAWRTPRDGSESGPCRNSDETPDYLKPNGDASAALCANCDSLRAISTLAGLLWAIPRRSCTGRFHARRQAERVHDPPSGGAAAQKRALDSGGLAPVTAYRDPGRIVQQATRREWFRRQSIPPAVSGSMNRAEASDLDSLL